VISPSRRESMSRRAISLGEWGRRACPCIHPAWRLAVHLFTSPPVHLSLVHLSAYPPVHLSTCPPVHLSTCPPVHLSSFPPFHHSTSPPSHPPVHPTNPAAHLSYATCLTALAHLSSCPHLVVYLSVGTTNPTRATSASHYTAQSKTSATHEPAATPRH
jgi:hypothetical protein